MLHALTKPIPPPVSQHVLAVTQRVIQCSFDAAHFLQSVTVPRNDSAHASSELLHKRNWGQHTGHGASLCSLLSTHCTWLPALLTAAWKIKHAASSGRIMIACYNVLPDAIQTPGP